ncbi:helix-turn-helix transcriptional regulator [Bradyrhizobium sediminis]|uniref:Helix-turn-helix transcriptional regulator n=1 Tax=Bradyrhizobium sediminis TaxID=2840469 RepID=A0A975NDJ6_9BRAD|nr:helix-turn-helix transcriptional regulator [Bradyrhizobium sediminis]QWG12880.1 helix-turn-helix transcriptional regulator [Bradyrhizobium sediminis]
MRLTDGVIASLTEKIYDAALAPEAWQALALDLAQVLRGQVAICRHAEQPIGIYAVTGDPAAMADYTNHYWRLDLGIQRLARSRPGVVLTDVELAGPDPAWSEFVNDFVHPMGCGAVLYASPYRHGDEFVSLVAARELRAGPYDETSLYVVQQLSPHIARSLAIQERMRAARLESAASIEALERAAMAVLVVNGQGRLRFANAVAEAQLRKGVLALSRGHVGAGSTDATRVLHRAIRSASAAGLAETVSLPRPGGRGPLPVTVCPAGVSIASAVGGDPRLVLLLFSVAPASLDQSCVARAFGLTPAETRLLMALVEGERLSDYAARRSIRITTVKTHLRSLFLKTGEQRQADLIRRVMSEPLFHPMGK